MIQHLIIFFSKSKKQPSEMLFTWCLITWALVAAPPFLTAHAAVAMRPVRASVNRSLGQGGKGKPPGAACNRPRNGFRTV